MTRDEKIEAIEDMGINILTECPSFRGISTICKVTPNNACLSTCQQCWIDTLEGKQCTN